MTKWGREGLFSAEPNKKQINVKISIFFPDISIKKQKYLQMVLTVVFGSMCCCCLITDSLQPHGL